MKAIKKFGFFLLLIFVVTNLAGCDESKTPRQATTQTETSINENSETAKSTENTEEAPEDASKTSPPSNTEAKANSNSNSKPKPSASQTPKGDKSDGDFTKTVKFGGGNYGRTYTGKIEGDRQVYVLGASGGQTLTVTSTEVDFSITAPDGSQIHSGSGNYSGTLPADGNYRITINDFVGKFSSVTKYSITFLVT